MACTIPIPFWPTSTDCLSWSADNQIAVTGGEQVAILTPRLKNKGPNGRLWDTTLLKVNAFTSKELPLYNPLLSTVNFSIGEDLSLRQALEAKWSPPGLALHKGCALAVLTANHVLSIWVPNGRSDVAENWKRQVIINHAIAEYYEATAASRPTDANLGLSEQQLVEQSRVRQRIRSFAWSPPLVRDGQACGDEEYYLAVSTESGDILFLRIVSPSNRPTTRNLEWAITVVGSLNLELHLKNLLQYNVNDVCIGHYLGWDRWKTDDTGDRLAQFAYVCGGRLFTASIKRHSNAFGIDMSKLHLRDRSDVYGPIQFVPGDQADSLIAFGDDTVFQVDVGAAAHNRTHHLDGRWDKVSGVAFTNPGDSSTLVHISSLLSMSTASTTTLSLPLQEHETSIEPSWQHAICESKAVYGADLDVGGQVLERTSGIASSPMGDYVSTFTTMHPSDCIEYVIGSDQTSALNITWESESSQSNILPPLHTAAPPQPSSAEALLFSLVRQLERYAESEEPVEVDRGLLTAEVLHCSPFRQDIHSAGNLDTSPPVDSSPEGIFHHLKQALCAQPDILSAQALRIVDIALKPSMPRSQIVRRVVLRLVEEVLKLPSDVVDIDIHSERIRATFAIVSAKLTSPEQSTDTVPHPNNLESCKICQQPIPFEALQWARCSSGHQFSRCALSFLPVQEPGITKSCGICGLQYLNEKVFSDVEPTTDDIEMADVPSAEGNIDAPANDTWVEVSHNLNAFPRPTRTLAQILFAACDLCIYCGGKFVD